MYLKEIEYIVKIADEKSLTRAAEKLFITPSALTQQLNHLEADLGVTLFVRNRGDWNLTPEGQIYLENGRKMLSLRKDTLRKIQDAAEQKKGTLSIGFPPERGSLMFSKVYPTFHKMYPDIRINIYELQTKYLQRMVSEDKLDFAFLVMQDSMRTGDNYLPLADLELLLALPESSPYLDMAKTTSVSRFPELSLESVKQEPFAIMFKDSTIRTVTEQLLKKKEFYLDVFLETSRTRTIIEMISAGLCCGLIPESRLLPQDKVRFCSLPEHPFLQICACKRQGGHLSKSMSDFIELAAEYWKNNR